MLKIVNGVYLHPFSNLIVICDTQHNSTLSLSILIPGFFSAVLILTLTLITTCLLLLSALLLSLSHYSICSHAERSVVSLRLAFHVIIQRVLMLNGWL